MDTKTPSKTPVVPVVKSLERSEAMHENPWHQAMEPLDRDWMRRRRCLDVTVDDAGSFSIWAMFRDTVGEEDGAEVVLHEYAVTASGVGTTVGAIAAEPRVLPFSECPAAALAVGDLVGCQLAELSRSVPELLTGIRSCTHLNDLLRALGGVADLVAGFSKGP